VIAKPFTAERIFELVSEIATLRDASQAKDKSIVAA